MTAVRSLIRDVFRQARASGLTALLLVLTALAACSCFLLSWQASTGNDQSVDLFIHSIPIARGVNLHDAVVRFQSFLAGIVADTIGVLVALIWTSGFLPSFLEPAAASVMLSKPTSRATVFVARWVGVVLFVALVVVAFVGATWAAIGIRTGIWNANYWLSAPLLVIHFAVFYAFSALLAVTSRSATVCIVGSILFWALCWGMNFGRHALAGIQLDEVQRASAGMGRLVELSYWIMPKPADFGLILADALGAEQFAAPWLAFKAVREAGHFHPWASVASSLIAGAVFLAIAGYEFVHDEY